MQEQLVDTALIQHVLENKLERPFRLYLFLRGYCGKTDAGYYYVEKALQEASKYFKRSMRTLKRHHRQLEDIEWVVPAGKKHRIVSIKKIVLAIHEPSRDAVLIHPKAMFGAQSKVKAFFIECFKAATLQNRYRYIKGQLRRERSEGRQRRVRAIVEKGCNEPFKLAPNVGLASQRLIAGKLGLSIATISRAKQISDGRYAHYYRRYDSTVDEANLKNESMLFRFIENCGSPDIHRRRFEFSTKLQRYRMRVCDLIESAVTLKRRSVAYKGLSS